jgi:signal peptidase I
MKIALNTLYYSLIGLAGLVGLVFAATLMPIPGNIEIKVVKSGSMEPAIQVGSIVVIKPTTSYSVGDVITFGKDTKTQIPTTHRIVEVRGEGAQASFITKGDANDTADNTVTPLREVKGKMLITVPYVGYALAFLRTKLGFMLLVGVPALAVFLEEGRMLFIEIRKMLARRRRRTPAFVEVRARATPHQEAEPGPRRIAGDIRPRKAMLLVFAATVAIGCAALGSAYGNTLAYYGSAATSQGNMLRAAESFDAPPLSIEVSETTIDVEDLPAIEVAAPEIAVTE